MIPLAPQYPCGTGIRITHHLRTIHILYMLQNIHFAMSNNVHVKKCTLNALYTWQSRFTCQYWTVCITELVNIVEEWARHIKCPDRRCKHTQTKAQRDIGSTSFYYKSTEQKNNKEYTTREAHAVLTGSYTKTRSHKTQGGNSYLNMTHSRPT